MSENKEFQEGDVLATGQGEYLVEEVGRTTDERPLQYVLEPTEDAPEALLFPMGNGEFVLRQYYNVNPEVVK